MQNLAGKSAVIGKPLCGQNHCRRPFGPRESLAGQRIPNRFVEQSRGVAAADHKLTNVEMIRMPAGKAADRVFALGGAWLTGAISCSQCLQHGQSAQLQRIEFQRIASLHVVCTRQTGLG